MKRKLSLGMLLAVIGMAAPSKQPDYGRLALGFEPNRGQADARNEYIAHGAGYSVALRKGGIVLNLRTDAGQKERQVSVTFAGGRQQAKPTALDQLPGTVNYFRGAKASSWQTNIPTYGRIEYRDVYPGVDVVYYGTQGRLEYDLVLAAGADPSRIRLAIAGGALSIASNGDLLIGPVRQEQPVVYQQRPDGSRRKIACRYALAGRNEVSFKLDAYDRSRKLTIDPVLSYSTYLGGSANDGVACVKVDSTGAAYVTGFTASSNFPTRPGAVQPSNKGLNTKAQYAGFGDVFVAKLNPAGTALVFSTYLGGSSDDTGTSLAFDDAGNVYVTGDTKSPDFPVTAGALQTKYGGTDNGDGFYDTGDAFVAKLNPTGSQLLYSTYLGGALNDMAWGITVDSGGNAVVAGSTLSSNFPTTANAISTSYRGSRNFAVWRVGDAFVAKLNPTGTALIYSTYLGGRQDDQAKGLALDAQGNAYVCGWTYSPDFPVTTGAYQTTFKGSEPTGNGGRPAGDAFVSKLSPAGALVYSTYLGGTFREAAWAIAVDSAGNAVVAGATQSTNFPATAGVVQTTYKGSGAVQYASDFFMGDAFVAKLNAAGTSLVFATYMGGTADEVASGVAVDPQDNIFVTGFTLSKEFPVSSDALQSTYGGHGGQGGIGFNEDGSGIQNIGDAFLAKFTPTGTMVYSSFFGGKGDEASMSVAVDAAGNPYIGGGTVSADMKVSTGVVQTSYGGNGPVYPRGDGFVAKFDFGGKLPAAAAKFSAVPGMATSGAPGATLTTPFTVEVLDAASQPISGIQVTFAATNATVSPASASTDGTGRASTKVTLGTAGNATVTATIAGMPSVTQTISVSAAAAGINLSAAASATSVTLGSDVTYTFTAANTGGAAAGNLKLTATIAGGAVQIASGAVSTGTCSDLAAAAPQISCTAASVAAGGSAVLTIKGSAQQVGTTQIIVNAVWDGGTQQSSQLAVAVLPPAGSLKFAAPLLKSSASGAPLAVAVAGPNVYLLTSGIEVFQNNPGAQRISLTAQPPIALPSGSVPAGLLALDLNADQRADVLVLDSAAGTVTPYLAGDSGYTAGQPITAGTAPSAMATVDLNGDANRDLAVAGDSGITLLTSNGDGTFTAGPTFDLPGRQTRLVAIVAGAFTGAGRDDLVLADAGGNVWLLPSDGMGGFGDARMTQAAADTSALAIGDFNGDGFLDVVAAGSSGVSLLTGDGTGNLAAAVNFTAGAGAQAIVAADLNGDGIPDLAVAASGSNAVYVLAGDGAGGFAAAVPYAAGSMPVALAVGDLDGDGKADLVVANELSRDFGVLLNQN
jgi:uncharacterized repeat protein (TIGR01451 family)